jgi:hypothetical protein
VIDASLAAWTLVVVVAVALVVAAVIDHRRSAAIPPSQAEDLAPEGAPAGTSHES